MTPPQMVSFAWDAGRSKQVVYVGPDSHVHELHVTAGGSWSHADLSSLAGATGNVASNFDLQLLAFAWEDNRSKHVFFVDDSNHVHELSVSAGGSWGHADLTGIVPLYLQYLGTGYAWKAGRSKHLVVPEGGGAIVEAHVAVGGRWGTRNLTHDAAVPVPPRTYSGFGSFVGGASFTGYNWSAANSQQVAYIGTDGHVHELFSAAEGAWSHADLTSAAGAPPPSSLRRNSFIAGYGWEEGRFKQVLYFDDSGAIHELFCPVGGRWQSADLTALTGAPRVTSSTYHRMVGYAWPEGRTKQVVYIGDDRHVHELVCPTGGAWSHADLTAIAGAPNAHAGRDVFSAHAWSEQGTKQVAYVGADSHIHELYVGAGGTWQFADLTRLTGGPVVRVV